MLLMMSVGIAEVSIARKPEPSFREERSRMKETVSRDLS